jgi:uncharacterized membrane protein YcaP (DUF421 family)
MPRNIVEPTRMLLLLVGLAILPSWAVVTDPDNTARASVLHVAIGFLVLLAAFRLLGKRELGRLSPFELVTLMLIPEILSNAMQGEAELLPSLAGLCAILFLVLLSSVLSQRFEGVQKVLEADPTLLVADGKLITYNMNKERIAPDELMSEMRKQGLHRLEAVRFAVLESSGNITLVPFERDGLARSSEQDDPRPG